jgi:dihydroorotate dehydrogenase
MLPSIGFGFSTVGTVTNIPYEGNSGPLFARLPKSKSLLVNKGFKNDGAKVIANRLNDPAHKNITFGVSVGSSNVPEINTISKAIDDYVACFETIDKVPYHKFYELNISCPNIELANSFTTKENFTALVGAVKELNIKRPIFVKMSNELSDEALEVLVRTAIDTGIHGFIFSNLVKDRNNPVFDKQEIEKVANLKGNFSGKPTQAGSNKHIKYFREKFGKDLVILGTGGIFNSDDAQTKLDLGADLVQLITGMIFEGPQLIGQINRGLAKNLMVK